MFRLKCLYEDKKSYSSERKRGYYVPCFKGIDISCIEYPFYKNYGFIKKCECKESKLKYNLKNLWKRFKNK